MDIILKRELRPERARFLREFARNIVYAALSCEGRDPGESEVSVLFTDDVFIADLNSQYRGVEGPTDVLSFAMSEDGGDTDAFHIPGLVDMLGDIVVSLETAQRQAEQEAQPEDDRIALLLVHGLLHLLGYDHDRPEKEAIMWERQEKVLESLKDGKRPGDF